MAAIALLTASGCAVTRGQETVGAYIDDATITTKIKAEFAKLGLSGRNVPLAEFDAYIKTDMDKLGPFVKASGAKAE